MRWSHLEAVVGLTPASRARALAVMVSSRA